MFGRLVRYLLLPLAALEPFCKSVQAGVSGSAVRVLEVRAMRNGNTFPCFASRDVQWFTSVLRVVVYLLQNKETI